jgi:hypothetical protein
MKKACYSIKMLLMWVVALSFYPINNVKGMIGEQKDSLSFSYEIVQRRILPFKRIDLPKFATKRRVIRAGSDVPNTLTVYREHTSPLKIAFYQYSLNWFDNKGIRELEKIELAGKAYFIDSIFRNRPDNRPLRLEMSAMYEFSYNHREFVSIHFEKTDFNGTGLQPWYILLCEITDPGFIKLYGLVTLNNNDESYQAPTCIGDFDLDGSLEFAEWDNLQGNVVRCVRLREGQRLLQPYFLILYEAEKGNFYIDTTNSKWCFPLK